MKKAKMSRASKRAIATVAAAAGRCRCNKCGKPAEFDSPDVLCANCWANWFVEGLKGKHRAIMLKDVWKSIRAGRADDQWRKKKGKPPRRED